MIICNYLTFRRISIEIGRDEDPEEIAQLLGKIYDLKGSRIAELKEKLFQIKKKYFNI